MIGFSCKGCEKRFPGCHAKCEIYIAEKAEHDKYKAELDKAKFIRQGIYMQRTTAILKMKGNRKGGGFTVKKKAIE